MHDVSNQQLRQGHHGGHCKANRESDSGDETRSVITDRDVSVILTFELAECNFTVKIGSSSDGCNFMFQP